MHVFERVVNGNLQLLSRWQLVQIIGCFNQELTSTNFSFYKSSNTLDWGCPSRACPEPSMPNFFRSCFGISGKQGYSWKSMEERSPRLLSFARVFPGFRSFILNLEEENSQQLSYLSTYSQIWDFSFTVEHLKHFIDSIKDGVEGKIVIPLCEIGMLAPSPI